LSEEQKQSDRRKSKVRARVEHIFGAQQAMGGHLVRTIGLARAKVKIGLMNLVYNMRRLVQLLERDAAALSTIWTTLLPSPGSSGWIIFARSSVR
jgi:transposase, IS5 family